MQIGDISVVSIDGQHLVCLLYVLRQFGGIHERREVNEYIRNHVLLALTEDDYLPYPSQVEPSWCTDIAWARKIGVIMGFINGEEWNCWEINRDGVNELERVLRGGEDRMFKVEDCFLWSVSFKKTVCSKYLPSESEAKRPPKKRRIDNPLRHLEETRRIFAEGKGSIMAGKLSQRLHRTIPENIISCALAQSEWESTIEELY